MQSLLDNPQFVQQMSSVMADPAILEQVIASSPQLQAMGPSVREIFQSEGFRQMMCVRRSLHRFNHSQYLSAIYHSTKSTRNEPHAGPTQNLSAGCSKCPT